MREIRNLDLESERLNQGLYTDGGFGAAVAAELFLPGDCLAWEKVCFSFILIAGRRQKFTL